MRIINLLLRYILGLKEFNVGDNVMVRVHPECLSKHSLKKLHTQAIGPFPIIRRLGANACLLDLPGHMNISPFFQYKGFISLLRYL